MSSNGHFQSKHSLASAVHQALKGKNVSGLSAMIEIADRCNEVCVHCYQIQGQKGEMTTAQIKNVMNDLAAMGVLFLTISGGEATLRHDFIEIMTHARDLKFATKLYTNGLTMTQALAKTLSQLAVQEVQISLYSHRAEVHDWVTGVPGSWEKTVAGIRHLVTEKVAVVIKTPLLSVNENDRADYVSLAASLKVDYTFDITTLSPGEGGDSAPVALSRSQAAAGQALSELYAKQPQPSPTEKALSNRVCGAARNIHVEANGEIRPCTLLEISCGHTNDTGIKRSEEEAENAAFVKNLNWGDLHGCRDCDLRAHCSRCYFRALVKTNDALGPYADACANAKQNYRASLGLDVLTVQCEPGRTEQVGPFKKVSPHELLAVRHVIESKDIEKANKFRSMHPKVQDRAVEPTPIRSGELIQIRRPGKKPRLEQVPV